MAQRSKNAGSQKTLESTLEHRYPNLLSHASGSRFRSARPPGQKRVWKAKDRLHRFAGPVKIRKATTFNADILECLPLIPNLTFPLPPAAAIAKGRVVNTTERAQSIRSSGPAISKIPQTPLLPQTRSPKRKRKRKRSVF